MRDNVNSSFLSRIYFMVNDVSAMCWRLKCVTDRVVRPCIRYVCVTQRKDSEEELLSALLVASRWQFSDNPPATPGPP